MYVATPSTPKVRKAMSARLIACMTTPAQGNKIPDGAIWAADNGAFGNGYPGDEAWLAWLASRTADPDLCLFATAPDVVGDAVATLQRSAPFLPLIRDLGYPAALVAQDGLEHLFVPWDDFDCLFLGGSTEWKLSPAAAGLVNQALALGKWVHMGRVNSRKRWTYAEHIGCHSVDGTCVAIAPDIYLPQVLSWSSQQGFDFDEMPA
jgi:hypothetical protein